jgi:hypothetical protein
MQSNVNAGADARQRFVDRVVYNFIEEMVKPVRAGAPDVHRGPPPDAFQTFQYLDLFRGVAGRVRHEATLRSSK